MAIYVHQKQKTETQKHMSQRSLASLAVRLNYSKPSKRMKRKIIRDTMKDLLDLVEPSVFHVRNHTSEQIQKDTIGGCNFLITDSTFKWNVLELTRNGTHEL